MARAKKNRGMTFIEISMAILIIGVLAMIALPRYNKAAFRAKAISYASPKLRRIVDAEKAYFLKHDSYLDVNVATATPAQWEALGLDVPNDNKYNYGFEQGSVTFTIANNLGFPLAYALPYPFTVSAMGNSSYHEIGVSIDGKVGVVYSNNTFEGW